MQRKTTQAVAKAIIDTVRHRVPYSADISDEAAVKNMVACAIENYGRIDVLHNNAAMTGNDFIMRDTDVANMDVDLWERTMAVNLRGPMLCAKHTIDRKSTRLNSSH